MEKKEKPKFISVKGKNPPVSQRKSFKSKFKNNKVVTKTAEAMKFLK